MRSNALSRSWFHTPNITTTYTISSEALPSSAYKHSAANMWLKTKLDNLLYLLECNKRYYNMMSTRRSARFYQHLGMWNLKKFTRSACRNTHYREGDTPYISTNYHSRWPNALQVDEWRRGSKCTLPTVFNSRPIGSKALKLTAFLYGNGHSCITNHTISNAQIPCADVRIFLFERPAQGIKAAK